MIEHEGYAHQKLHARVPSSKLEAWINALELSLLWSWRHWKFKPTGACEQSLWLSEPSITISQTHQQISSNWLSSTTISSRNNKPTIFTANGLELITFPLLRFSRHASISYAMRDLQKVVKHSWTNNAPCCNTDMKAQVKEVAQQMGKAKRQAKFVALLTLSHKRGFDWRKGK